MSKDIVVCCDGTGNEYGRANSNVVKLYWTLAYPVKHTAYYHPGLGTMGARSALSAISKWWTKVKGLAFGYGLSDNIADVYSFLMASFEPGDRIFFFGFSRGAYTARAVCGLLQMFGLLTPGNEALIPYAIRLLKSNDPRKFEIAAAFRRTFSVPCAPHFLGLWDTVSSVGWFFSPIFIRGGNLPFTATLHDIPVVRHAVSIDERRAFFRQNLFHEPAPPNQDLQQVWFPGTHSDVGGSDPENESGLSKIALRWILCEAQSAGLSFDSARVMAMLGGSLPYVAPDFAAQLHKSLHGIWWLAELWPKLSSRVVSPPGQTPEQWKQTIRINFGRARFIPPNAHIHQSAFDRMQNPATKYHPKNLPQAPAQQPAVPCELVPRPVHGQPVPAPPRPPLRRHPAFVTALVLFGLVLLSVLAIAIFTVAHTIAVPKIERPPNVVWLAQNWSDDQRERFYHIPQGNELLPYAWFLALEQPRLSVRSDPLFRDEAYLEGFGFIPDGRSNENPDGLPVGFTRDDSFADPYTGEKNAVVGLTCAACHTGELFYKDKALRIDAGPSLLELQKFNTALGLAVFRTYYDIPRFHRFAHRVLGPNPPHADEVRLRKALKYFLDTSWVELKANLPLFPTPEGYGRSDALARIGNFVFGTELNNRKNYRKGNAPANFPPIWDASWMDWVQYNGSIQQPMGRNVGEALGVRSRVNLVGYPGRQLENTIRVDNLHEVENLIGGAAPGNGVWSPRWPEDIFGKIDRDKAAKGEQLYNQMCVGCHQPPMLSDEGRKPEHWTAPNASGRQFFKVTMIPLAEIGTDPAEAENFAQRTADSGPLGLGVVSASDGLKYITQRVIEQAYADFRLSPQEQDEWNGYRMNELRAPLAYKARPHNGIWATPPYLHNGSVPNLYALLSPVAERPKVFYLGRKEYDPVKLGLSTEPLKGAAEFRTDRMGNSNAGHEFNDGPKGNGVIGRKLSELERMEIIEYLKTL